MSLKDKVNDLNRMILSGESMDAFEKYYHEDVSMQENSDPPTVGKSANRERETQTMSMIEEFFGANLISTTFGDDITMSEWEMDIKYKGAPRQKMCQVAVQKWKDGQIINERFYYSN
jgi:hypothetical protein